MNSFDLDTSAAAARMQVDLWRRMSPLQKVEAVRGINRAVRDMALIGIRQRHPQADERECFLRWAVLSLGEETAVRVYPDAAAVVGRPE